MDIDQVIVQETQELSDSTDPNSKPVKYRIYSLEQAFRHMTQERSDDERILYQIVDEVLFNVWDALCLSIDHRYREEYIPYLPHVYELLKTTEDGQELFDYLVFVEETKMSDLKDDALIRRRASRVVEILLEYRESILGEQRKTN